MFCVSFLQLRTLVCVCDRLKQQFLTPGTEFNQEMQICTRLSLRHRKLIFGSPMSRSNQFYNCLGKTIKEIKVVSGL